MRCAASLSRALAIALAILITGCEQDCSPPAGAARPNVVLITIDTLRADHLGAYGSTTVRTPHLDALARDGALFEHAYSQSHITVPSHISILGSLPVMEHGVADNLAPVARRVDLLPLMFRRAGYRTAAFVGATHLGPRRAVGQLAAPGLETFEFPPRPSKPRRAEETNERFFAWLRGTCGNPFFVWLHYWDPHMPYVPPAPYDDAYYHDDPYAERFTSMLEVHQPWYHHDLSGLRALLARHAGDIRDMKRRFGLRTKEVKQLVLYPVGAHAHDPTGVLDLQDRLRAIGRAIRPHLPLRPGLADWLTGVRDVRFPMARYAGEVSYVDAQVGAVRAELERLKIDGRTIVAVTADHGELLGEHGVWFEHLGLHDPAVHVPLIIWAPGRVEHARRRDDASGLDIAPTLLRLAGLPAVDTMRGRDLFSTTEPVRPIVSEASRDSQLSIRVGRWKLIRTLDDVSYAESFERVAGTVELYDLDSDPNESHDVARTQPEWRARLDASLDAWVASHHRAHGRGPLAADRAEDLRALGYVE